LGKSARSSFSEEKEAKILSALEAAAMTAPTPPGTESFLVTFFQKSNVFLIP
jgi:hypothetical protein